MGSTTRKPQKTGCGSSPPQDASPPALLNGKLPNPAELNRFPASSEDMKGILQKTFKATVLGISRLVICNFIESGYS